MESISEDGLSLSRVDQYFVLISSSYRLIIEPWMLPAGEFTYI